LNIIGAESQCFVSDIRGITFESGVPRENPRQRRVITPWKCDIWSCLKLPRKKFVDGWGKWREVRWWRVEKVLGDVLEIAPI
jgi:hypothetical protein